MRATIRIEETDPRYDEMVEKANNALAQKNIRIVARGEKNKKADISGIEKNGITFYVAGFIDDGDQMYTVYKGNATPYDIADAKVNTVADARIGGIMDMMFGSGGKPIDIWEPSKEPMCVLTNERKVNGAGAIFCDEVMKMIYKKIGTFFILPSSVHEVIIVPETDKTRGPELAEMVRMINGDMVLEDEQLSDKAFFYDGTDWE